MARRGRAAGAAILLLLGLGGGEARAREVWRSEDGALQLDVGGHLKSYATGLHLPGGLADATAALAEAIEGARAQLPAEAAAGLPELVPLPDGAGLATQVARVEGRLLWGERLDFNAAWQLGAAIASHPAFARGSSLGGAPVGASASAARRLWDFDPVLVEEGGFRLQHDLDRLSLKLSLPSVDIVVGRQVLAWGSGKLWNPTDLLSPFAPTDIDKEVRRGVDALRVSVPLGVTGLLDTLWLPQPRWEDHGGVLRAQLNVLGYDLALSAAKYVSDLVFGADASGDAGPLGVHAEAAFTLGIAGWGAGPLRVEERFFRAVGGVEWRPLEDLVLLAEYYFNGFGASEPEGYLAKLSSERVASGEIFGAGRHYLGLVASWAATDLLTVQTTAIVNAQDPSAMFVPVLEYSVEQSVLLRAGGYLPVGRGPDARVAQGLTPADVLAGSDAFREAVTTLGLRSEYGASGLGAFVQLAVYR